MATSGLTDLTGSRAGLRNKATTSGNFLPWPRCPPPARPLPAPWFGAPRGRSQRRSGRRAPGAVREAASGGAEPPLSPPPPRRLIRGLSVPPGDAGPGRALGSAPSGLANFAGPAARRAAPRAHVRSGCGAAGTSAGLGDQGLSPAPGRGASCWPEAGAGRLCPPPLPGRSSARRAESLAGGPGSGGAAPPRTPGARRPPGQEKQRPPRPPQRLGRLGRSLAEPAALGFPGSASGEPLLPEPSGSCAGRVSRGRARRRRRRRRGEGGRALPRGRD
ncbi:collagen alpha-1(III) chain-like [Delphinapterus leucas]|uniref:Collagen alpha-1(III) chain-like n=1 Tax=Delphinapterus leucas TaxID=9749 RepID=A0A7F8KE22_DELLE|nr:collagen alpha-1(III) chain-like [Delphinapterus leucas]